MKFRLYPLIIFAIACTSCSSNTLSVHSDYLTIASLSSYYVHTPDPRLNHPPIGQRLYISWAIPKKYFHLSNLQIELTLRFRNREEIVELIPVKKSSGIYVYPLINEDYCEKRGFLTYRVRLLCGEKILEEWCHQTWAERILFEEPNEEETIDPID